MCQGGFVRWLSTLDCILSDIQENSFDVNRRGLRSLYRYSLRARNAGWHALTLPRAQSATYHFVLISWSIFSRWLPSNIYKSVRSSIFSFFSFTNMLTKSLIFLTVVLTFVSANNDNDVIEIINSGSSNTAGYVVTVQRTGLVTWTVNSRLRPTSSPKPSSTQLSASRTTSIFQAVEQALPLTQYKPVFCVKSVSFGTTLHLRYHEQQSPDLSCPMKEQQLLVLSKYVRELIAELHVNTLG